MPSRDRARLAQCNCLALRQAARHVTQFYDQYLASTGLRTTQFSILAKLHGLGPMTINALARELVMDRTTLGRTMLPLERDGLIVIRDGIADRRSKELAVTKMGTERCSVPRSCGRAQGIRERFGARRAAYLRGLLGEVVHATSKAPSPSGGQR